MSVKVLITIQNGENGYQKIDAKTLCDESSMNTEKITAGHIHEFLCKALGNECPIYSEKRKDIL